LVFHRVFSTYAFLHHNEHAMDTAFQHDIFSHNSVKIFVHCNACMMRFSEFESFFASVFSKDMPPRKVL